jgi:hypothetical protein
VRPRRPIHRFPRWFALVVFFMAALTLFANVVYLIGGNEIAVVWVLVGALGMALTWSSVRGA